MSQESQESLIGSSEIQAWEGPYRRVVGSLLQTCMVAARNGLHDDAEDILSSVESARPDHSSPKYARALLFLYRCQPERTVKYLKDNFLKFDPNNDMARALTCMALNAMDKQIECYDMVRDLIHNGRDEQAVTIARALAQDLKFSV